jgi:hypothetical protein
MAVGGEDDGKKYFRDRKMNLREVKKKYGRLVVLIRQNSAEIWGFRHGLTLCNGTAGVFVRVIIDLKALLAVTQELQSLLRPK